MIKKDFLCLKSSILQWVAFTAVLTGCFLVQGAQAAIDETMPTSIPKEILDDWKAQGTNIDEIMKEVDEEFKSKCDGSFESACHWRRVSRMKKYPQMETILFAKHHNLGGTAVGFWVNLGSGSNACTDSRFAAKGSLCLLKFENYYSQFKEILTKTNAAIKDPCISLDGKKVVYAVSGNTNNSGWRLYEMQIDKPGSEKQLTFNPSGLTVSDFEPCYLPNGDIMFSSSRCFGVIDCGWQATTNMYVMDSTGKYMRRLGYDQVHTCYPVLCPDGTILYTRWEYNDRDVSNVMGLFSMNPDGTAQTEVYGNQTTWPQTFIHGRPVPGAPTKFFAVASGHHGEYSGEVFICDNLDTTNGTKNITMISPPRTTETRDKNDTWAMGGVWRNSVNPYPLDEKWYLVGYREENKMTSFMDGVSSGKYRIYLKSVDGKSRELLAWSDQSLHRPVLVAPWKAIWGQEPVKKADMTNYNDSMGSFTMNDVYYGAGMKGVDKKSRVAKSLRVIALRYRVAGACDQGYADMVMGPQPSGVVFGAPTINPIATGGCSWEAKQVLGEAKIYEDGSAAFKVPARVPLYFEVLDSNGCMIAGMRSWATLMPGESFPCYGCHENRKQAPPVPGSFMAGAAGIQELSKPLGIEGKPFDYKEMVEPIIQKNCASCHTSGHKSGFDLSSGTSKLAKKDFSKSYLALTKGLKATLKSGVGVTASNKAVCITSIFSQPEQMPPYSYGSTQSGMIKNLLKGHNDVKLSDKDFKILACWIDLECPHSGKYDSYMSSGDASKYKSLEATAQKWYDIEAANCSDWAKVQQVSVMPDNFDNFNTVKAVTVAKRFNIGYLPTERALVIVNASQGNLILVDLKGTVVSRINLTDMNASGNVTIALSSALSTGVYIAKLTGVNGIEQAKITVTK